VARRRQTSKLPLKSGVGIPVRNRKDEPPPGIAVQGKRFKRIYIDIKILLKIVAFKGTIRNFLNTLAVHLKGRRHPPKCFLTHFFRLKGTVSRDFRPSVFSSIDYPRPLINTLKYFRILFRIRRAIYENVLIPRYAA
jgi:hypothetical protein